jgi:hypothetical protein
MQREDVGGEREMGTPVCEDVVVNIEKDGE